ncbi:MAG: DUF1080 domain-containing protein, partial [Planctomycetales bacterium]
MTRWLSSLTVAVCCAVAIGAAKGQADPIADPFAPPAAPMANPADPSNPAAYKKDVDFLLQGEYTNMVYQGRLGYEITGLQIIALGNGEFQAVETRGGLPGLGADPETRTVHDVFREDNLLFFDSGDREIIIENGHAVVRGIAAGRHKATLKKANRQSPTLGAEPPQDAVVLFNGTSTDQFTNGKMTENGLLEAGAIMKDPVRNFRLHIEFRTPYMPNARGQKRGNSGVYIQERYEVQILD